MERRHATIDKRFAFESNLLLKASQRLGLLDCLDCHLALMVSAGADRPKISGHFAKVRESPVGLGNGADFNVSRLGINDHGQLL
jgi:hypothetical protein